MLIRSSFTGSIIASGAVRGSLNLTGNVTWLIPVWLQLLCSGMIVLLLWWLPESPRWLYVNNKQIQAKAMLTKYHGEGNEDSPWVQLQLREYNEFLELDGADKRWWDYRALFRNRASMYRLGCNCTISIFGQWAGNCEFVLSYYTKFLRLLSHEQRYLRIICSCNILLFKCCPRYGWNIQRHHPNQY